jgi:DNA-binding NarL/FixJ family response regulator
MNNDGTRCVGVIHTYNAEAGAPRAEQFEDLDLYTSVAGSAIERHLMLSELSEKARLLSSLSWLQRQSLSRIQDRVRLIERGAFSLEPADFRRLAQEILNETKHALSDLKGSGETAPEGLAETRTHKYGMSARELQVLFLMWRGLPDKQIAAELGISRYTVGMHVKHILHKMGFENRTQASVRAEQEGFFAGLSREQDEGAAGPPEPKIAA